MWHKFCIQTRVPLPRASDSISCPHHPLHDIPRAVGPQLMRPLTSESTTAYLGVSASCPDCFVIRWYGCHCSHVGRRQKTSGGIWRDIDVASHLRCEVVPRYGRVIVYDLARPQAHTEDSEIHITTSCHIRTATLTPSDYLSATRPTSDTLAHHAAPRHTVCHTARLTSSARHTDVPSTRERTASEAWW